MRSEKIIKTLIIIFVIILNSSMALFSFYNPDEYKIDFLNIEEVTYSATKINTEDDYQTDVISSEKVIKITEITTNTTSSESYRAVPHINIENYLSTISNDTNTSICRLLVKTTIDYDNIADETTWYEIDDVKTYLYNRTNLEQQASSFTTTFYYLIENPNNVLNPDGSSNNFLTINTGGTTNYYMFYLLNNVEQPYYSGNLSDSLSLKAIPEQFDDPSITSYLQINAYRPASWSETALFETPSTNNLEWIIALKAGLTSGNTTNDKYFIGLTITSQNNFVLKSNNNGSGIKEYPYTLKISKRNATTTYNVNVGDEFFIQKISDTITKYFYLYTYSTTPTTYLNAGRFSDNIYLNFITDIDTNYGNKTVTVFTQ